MATHFILVYAVNCYSPKTQETTKRYYYTEPREIKYYEILSRCNPEENVAVFKITPK